MSTITASTIIVATTITRGFQQSRDVDNYIAASLAADAGLERSLSVIKTGRGSASIDVAVSSAVVASAVAIDSSNARIGTFTVDSQAKSAPLTYTLTKDKSVTFDLLRTTTAPLPPQTSLPLTIRVTGSAVRDGAGSCIPAGACGVLDVSWTMIRQDGNTNFSGRDFIDVNHYESGGTTVDLTTVRSDVDNTPAFNGSTPLGFRITVTARQADVQNIKLQPLYPDGSNADINSKINITSTGNSDTAQAQKKAEVLWQPPSSGLFNYVLFTEGNIIPS